MEEWVKQPEWHGNPSLGYESWMKKFTVRGIKTPVYLFGKEGDGKNIPCRDINGNITHYQDFSDWHYCVKGSHSGGFYPLCPTLEEAKIILDNKNTL